MYLNFVKAETSTPCGLPIRAVLTSYYKSKHFQCRHYDPFNDLTSPIQTILCEDSNQSMYCQLLAALIQRHKVLRLGPVFASAFLRAISYLEQKWGELCEDIRTGLLNPMITDPGCQIVMSCLLTSPNPELASEIEEICRRPLWEGILCQLWPKAKFIEAVGDGLDGSIHTRHLSCLAKGRFLWFVQCMLPLRLTLESTWNHSPIWIGA